MPHIKLQRLHPTELEPTWKYIAKSILKKEINFKSKMVKMIFSISIIGSAIPSVYMDFTYGHSGHFSHYGMILVGFLYGVESLLWTLDLWKKD
tara:strand:- start:129 stop:407 length:279 start_codon:yes stop_codon:yes gene_type:complete